MKGHVMYGLPGHGKTGFYTLEMGNHWMALFFKRSACAFLSGLFLCAQTERQRCLTVLRPAAARYLLLLRCQPGSPRLPSSVVCLACSEIRLLISCSNFSYFHLYCYFDVQF